VLEFKPTRDVHSGRAFAGPISRHKFGGGVGWSILSSMRSRRGRLILFLALLLIGVVAAVMTWDLQRRVVALGGAEQDLAARLDRMIATTSDIATAQQAYVAPGQPDDLWFARVSSLIQQLSGDLDAVRSRARSIEATGALQAVADATRGVAQLDSQVRENLRFGEDLIAADLIFADGRGALDAAAKELRGVRDAERAASGGERAALLRQTWATVGAAALLWLAGLALLVRAPRMVPAPPVVAAAPPVVKPVAAPEPAAAPHRLPLDLGAAADLCTAISRMTTTIELPGLLARAAAVLDASGLIVWMSAGEELFAVTAHGYDPRVISRLGAISRNADNATAASWRSGEIKVVAGDMISDGAVVAPMFGPATCIGVLAAEVRHGREDDADTRAVTALIAAQLATAVVAWPAASPAPAEAPPAAATGS